MLLHAVPVYSNQYVASRIWLWLSCGVVVLIMSACNQAPIPAATGSLSPKADAVSSHSPQRSRDTVNDRPIAENAQAAPGIRGLPDEEAAELIKMRFLHNPTRAQIGTATVLLPATDFGEVLLDVRTGRCLYRFWYDGLHENPLGTVGLMNEAARLPALPTNAFANTYKGVAACNGNTYWAARFVSDSRELDNRTHAAEVVTYNGVRDVKEYDSIDRPWSYEVTWLHYAPLHMLAETIACRNVRGDEFRDKCHLYSHKHEIGSKSISIDPMDRQQAGHLADRRWAWKVTFDDTTFGISAIDVRYCNLVNGAFPFPVPDRYSIIRDSNIRLSESDFVRSISFEQYVYPGSRIIKVDERGKQQLEIDRKKLADHPPHI